MSKSILLSKVPEVCDKGTRYLFYLHGLIIEVAGLRPLSQEHGYYEYKLILQVLTEKGYTVISEARPKGTEIQPYAMKICSQIKTLLAQGVPPGNITVVGASKGGIIASYVSCALQNKEINYVLLAGLFEKCLDDENLQLYGRVLSIHDSSDKLSIVPERFFERSEGLGVFKSIVLDLKLGHGLIYQPRVEWLEPLVLWSNSK